MGWPKGKPRGPQKPEHRAARGAAISVAQKRRWADPEARRRAVAGVQACWDSGARVKDRRAVPRAEERLSRVAAGLCPHCGAEAAPYFLCGRHRMVRAMGRLLAAMAKRDILEETRAGPHLAYRYKSGPKVEDMLDLDLPDTLFDMDPSDPRLRPKLGGKPVDVAEVLAGILRAAGRPMHEDELVAAWGRLRVERRRRRR